MWISNKNMQVSGFQLKQLRNWTSSNVSLQSVISLLADFYKLNHLQKTRFNWKVKMEKVLHQDILPFSLQFLMVFCCCWFFGVFLFFFLVKPKNPNTDFSSLGNWNLDIFVSKIQKFVYVLAKELAFLSKSCACQEFEESICSFI